MSKTIEPIAATRSWIRLPISRHTGNPKALPFRSHSAMSTALIAKAAIPSGPYHQTRVRSFRQSRSTSRGSSPTSNDAKPCSTITFVAMEDSRNWEMHSPHPTRPSSVSIRTSVT